MKTVLIYVITGAEVGDADRLKVFTNEDVADDCGANKRAPNCSSAQNVRLIGRSGRVTVNHDSPDRISLGYCRRLAIEPRLHLMKGQVQSLTSPTIYRIPF